MITRKMRSVKGPPRILVLKQKKGTTHLKIKKKQEEKGNR
jgi:hypothetical protein